MPSLAANAKLGLFLLLLIVFPFIAGAPDLVGRPTTQARNSQKHMAAAKRMTETPVWKELREMLHASGQTTVDGAASGRG